MTDTFSQFDSEFYNIGSPNFQSDQFQNNFNSGGFVQLDPHDPFLIQQNSNHYSPDNRQIEEMSDSNSSTNYSSKYSPENLDTLDNQSGLDRRSEDDAYSHSRIPPILKKGIQKYYEPLLDNNVTYIYEDDPSEYKKARKRIQNRESACRVRSKKKNYVGELEGEMNTVKKENSSLKMRVATLQAENNLLKQQNCFLEKMLMKNGQQQHITNAPITQNDNNFEDCLLPLVNKVEEVPKTKNVGYFRAAPPHVFKKHAGALGMMTLLFCVYGVMNNGASDSADAVYPGALTNFANSGGMAPKAVYEQAGMIHGSHYSESVGMIHGSHHSESDEKLKNLLKTNQDFNWLKSALKMTCVTMYIIYLVYVLCIVNWKYVFGWKNKTL